MSTREAASAVNRFGLGAMPGEIAGVRDPRAWLKAQLGPDAADAAFGGLPSSAELIGREAAARRERRQRREGDAPPRRPGRDTLRETGIRYGIAATTHAPFAERLVRFWSNHFAVSADKGTARLYAAPMEREAIRPHLLGPFADLLVAVASHPAMLRYLDNAASVGEASTRARRAARKGAPRRPGLNENLAREILELHTLGADAGYAQQDVRELARAITGWGLAGRDGPSPAQGADPRTGFLFRAGAHEPGTRTVMGKSYAADGVEQGRAILRDLAVHPATARHLALKLARHCVADEPDRALVRRMADAYLASGGDLSALYAAMIDHDAAWSAQARKYKTPDEFVVSAMRAGGFSLGARPRQLARLLRDLGQPVYTPRSPAGFPDAFGDWAAGDALRKRLQVAPALAARVDVAERPVVLAAAVLGEGALSPAFGRALRSAGSPRDGYALLFASPAFQWRT